MNGQIKIWTLADNSQITLNNGVSCILNAAFTPDASRLLVSLEDGRVGYWDLKVQPSSFQQVLRMEHQVWAAAQSSDGARVVIGDLGRRGTTLLLNATTGRPIALLKGQLGGIRAASFSNDGQRVLTASNDGTVWIWPLFASGDHLIAQAGARLPRCLSRKERTTLGLEPAPPNWCITGWGQENETDPAKWKPKWPYDKPQWRKWLSDRRAGIDAPMPKE